MLVEFGQDFVFKGNDARFWNSSSDIQVIKFGSCDSSWGGNSWANRGLYSLRNGNENARSGGYEGLGFRFIRKRWLLGSYYYNWIC